MKKRRKPQPLSLRFLSSPSCCAYMDAPNVVSWSCGFTVASRYAIRTAADAKRISALHLARHA